MSTFNLNTNGLETYEIGATILALLADPTHPDDARTLEVRRVLCGGALWFEHVERPEDAGTAIPVKPEYLWLDPVTVDREVQRVDRRLGERMLAGRMAQVFLLPAIDPDFKLPSSIKRRSLNEAARFVQEDAGQADAKNVLARMWRPSRQVIHLSAAAAFVGQTRARAGLATGLETFLFDQSHLIAVLCLARLYETVIESDPKFPVKADELIRVRLH